MGRVNKRLTKAQAYIRLMRKREYDREYQRKKYMCKRDGEIIDKALLV